MVQLLESQDAALVLGCGPASVRRYAESGDLPVAAVTRGRGLKLFRPGDVRKLKRKRERAKNGNGNGR